MRVEGRQLFPASGVNSSCATGRAWAGSGVRGSLGGGCGMEYPTEAEIRAMTNREFASLIRLQAERIDQTLHRESRPVQDSGGVSLPT
jgi:hypothetical protein